jgi:hypothetical protein
MTAWTPKLAGLVPATLSILVLFALTCVAGTIAFLLWRAVRVQAGSGDSQG